jgi:hypothetical protein
MHVEGDARKASAGHVEVEAYLKVRKERIGILLSATIVTYDLSWILLTATVITNGLSCMWLISTFITMSFAKTRAGCDLLI